MCPIGSAKVRKRNVKQLNIFNNRRSHIILPYSKKVKIKFRITPKNTIPEDGQSQR
jgi:hypothetical protein